MTVTLRVVPYARSAATNLKKLAVGHIDLVVSMMDDFKSDATLLARAAIERKWHPRKSLS